MENMQIKPLFQNANEQCKLSMLEEIMRMTVEDKEERDRRVLAVNKMLNRNSIDIRIILIYIHIYIINLYVHVYNIIFIYTHDEYVKNIMYIQYNK